MKQRVDSLRKSVDKPLPNLTKRHRKNIQITKIKSVNGDITTDKKNRQNQKDILKNLYSTKLKNLIKKCT